MSHDAWAKAKNVDSRNQPPDVSLWERLIKWILGRGGMPPTGSLETLIADWGEVPPGTVTVEPWQPVHFVSVSSGRSGSTVTVPGGTSPQSAMRVSKEPVGGIPPRPRIHLIKRSHSETSGG